MAPGGPILFFLLPHPSPQAPIRHGSFCSCALFPSLTRLTGREATLSGSEWAQFHASCQDPPAGPCSLRGHCSSEWPQPAFPWEPALQGRRGRRAFGAPDPSLDFLAECDGGAQGRKTTSPPSLCPGTLLLFQESGKSLIVTHWAPKYMREFVLELRG